MMSPQIEPETPDDTCRKNSRQLTPPKARRDFCWDEDESTQPTTFKVKPNTALDYTMNEPASPFKQNKGQRIKNYKIPDPYQ